MITETMTQAAIAIEAEMSVLQVLILLNKLLKLSQNRTSNSQETLLFFKWRCFFVYFLLTFDSFRDIIASAIKNRAGIMR